MARFTMQRGVPAKQRETRLLMLLPHVGNLPRLRRVATQALLAEIGFVHIGVAGEAVSGLCRELQPRMTARATRQLMLAGQRKTRCLVLERGILSHLPRIRRVALAALKADIPMW
jgi:hypothetical protein